MCAILGLSVDILRLLLLLGWCNLIYDKDKSFKLILLPQVIGDVVMDAGWPSGHPLRPWVSFTPAGVCGLGFPAHLNSK